MRFSLTREIELIWLRQLLLPLGLLFYCLSICLSIGVAIADWAGFVGTASGIGRVISLGLVGHLFAALLLTAQGLAGDAIIRRFGWQTALDGSLERLLFAIVAGFVASDFVLMLLATLGALNAPVVGGLGFAVLAAGLWSHRVRSSDCATAPWFEGIRSNLLAVACGIVFIAAAGFWLWPMLVQTALPNSDWDSALYHLPLAERYLEGKLWNSDPLFSANSFPGGVSLVYAVFLGFGVETAVIPYNFLFVLLNLVAAYALAARLGDRRAGAWAVLVCSGLHVLWQQGLDPRIDGFLSLFVATAMLALVIWLRDPVRVAPLYLLALSLGGAIGTKYTGVFISMAFAGLVLAVLAWQTTRGGARLSLASVAIGIALFAVPNSAWYVSNTILHGDPLFPMLRGDYYELTTQPGERLPMTSALDAVLADLPADSPARERARALGSGPKASPPSTMFDLIDVYRRPQAYSTKPNHFASPLLLLFVLLPLALPKDREQRIAWGAFYGLSLACFVGLASQTNLLRYTLPFLLLFGVGSALVIARFSHPLWRGFWLLGGLAVLASHHAPEARKLEQLRPNLYATSGADRLEWLKGVGYNFTRSMPIVIDRINREIEAETIASDSLILLAGEGKGRLLDCSFLPDLSWFMQRWTVELVRADFDATAVHDSLRRQGISHVLYNHAYFRWVVAHTHTDPGALAFSMTQLEAFLDSHGNELFELAGMRLVELRDVNPETMP
ncbi:MAG: glycosyltransferase family 39 protein [Deltaproteobacteria bacterium]|nr:glycosyltransferase family 39 protein [Deltaproteobacteria bacterium]MBW2389271.1 glycosyltransferase family 39 protein [Deltaproteobacteria bacterium]